MLRAYPPRDTIQLLEALYALEQPRHEWFRGVLEAAGPVFDRGAGVGMLLYDISGSLPVVDAMGGVNLPPENLQMGRDVHGRAAFARAIVSSYRNKVCATLPEHVDDPEVLLAMRERYARVGLQDQILINGANTSGLGCAMYAFSKTCIQLRASERNMLTWIATHLSAAYRLQRKLEQQPAAADRAVEAVCSVDGRIEHAESEARASEARRSLSAAVRLREKARVASTRSEQQHEACAWQPLVAGRWSLLDAYEPNGKRYITAHENAPHRPGQAALSARERQTASLAALGHSNKVIAHDLGLAHSTVRVLLARAAAKLGVSTRAELLERLRSSD
jgi:DNA-binding CsgD family transcriptional regulator